jgi:acyl-CoA synthetase (AMP-forming)/AMP-acid ligase II
MENAMASNTQQHARPIVRPFVTREREILMTIRGRRVSPGQVETSVRRSDPVLRRGSTAVFSMKISSEQRLVVVQEIDLNERVDLDRLAKSIRKRVFERHGIQVSRLIVVKPGSIPTSPGGEIKRNECESRLLQGRFKVLVEWRVL